MSWSERYAMAKGDTKEALLKKIQSKKDTESGLRNYHQSDDKASACNRNSLDHRWIAYNSGNKTHHAIANWWNELGDLHRAEEPEPEAKETEANVDTRPSKPMTLEQAMKQPHFIGGDYNNGWMPGTTGPKVI